MDEAERKQAADCLARLESEVKGAVYYCVGRLVERGVGSDKALSAAFETAVVAAAATLAERSPAGDAAPAIPKH